MGIRMPKILVVDDDALGRELAERCLKPLEKLEVVFATNGNEALESIPGEKPDRPLSFQIAYIVELMPVAGGPSVPDAFTDTEDGRGITWGISHFVNAGNDWDREHSVLARFDCDLSQDVDDQQMEERLETEMPLPNWCSGPGLQKKK